MRVKNSIYKIILCPANVFLSDNSAILLRERERERERERDDQRVSSRVSIIKRSRRNNRFILFFLFVFTDLREYTIDSIKKGTFSFILNDLKPLRKEYASFRRGFFALYEIQKLSRFYEPMYGNTEGYFPETFCVKPFISV
jgi:hypothetical protein